MLHLTCFSHGLHRLAEFVRVKFPIVNDLIASNKAVFIKAPSRRNIFFSMAPNIALPPSPCITRWCTWLKAALYYCDYFEIVRNVVNTFDDEDAEAIRKAKQLFNDPQVRIDLAYIKHNFAPLIKATIKFETQGLELCESIEEMESIRTSLKIMKSSEYSSKMEQILIRNKGYESLLDIYKSLYEGRMTLGEYAKNLSPKDILLFKFAPVSTADVERTFSAYSATLTEKRRSFSFDNLKQHLIMYCNQDEH